MWHLTEIAKITKGIESCLKIPGFCHECPYGKYNHDEQQCYPVKECVDNLRNDVLELIKEQKEQIERLEYNLAITQDNLNYYINGNA